MDRSSLPQELGVRYDLNPRLQQWRHRGEPVGCANGHGAFDDDYRRRPDMRDK